MAEKDKEIGEMLAWLREHVSHDLMIVDHWDADRCAIGVAAPGNLQRLVYISTWQRPSHRYFVELEAAPTEGSDMPYTSVGKFESVDTYRLAQLVRDHLNLPSRQYPCRCCGFLTLDEQPPGTFLICPVCYWEDDNVQADDPDYAGGANHVSLREAQTNFRAFGASEKRVSKYVRPPRPDEFQPGKQHGRKAE